MTVQVMAVEETLKVMQEQCAEFRGWRLICLDGPKVVYSADPLSRFNRDYANLWTALIHRRLGCAVDLVPVEEY